jgi:hypothetical protein
MTFTLAALLCKLVLPIYQNGATGLADSPGTSKNN